jgi:cytochrome c-type biogenesis protein
VASTHLNSYRSRAIGVGAFLVAVGVAGIAAYLTQDTGPLNTAVERLSASGSGQLGSLSGWLPLGFAFAAGMVSAVNPCGFPMLGPYLTIYLGHEGESSTGRTADSVLRALKIGATVTLGFVLLFGVVGVSIGLGANVLVRVFPWVGLGLGIMLAAVGAWLLSGGKLYSPAAQSLGSRIGSSDQSGTKAYFLFGLSYGTASLSCTLPIFLSVIGGSIAVSGLPFALGQFLLYGLGMGSVILALTLTLVFFKAGLARWLRAALPFVEKAGAVLLLCAGGYVTYYWLTIGGLGTHVFG